MVHVSHIITFLFMWLVALLCFVGFWGGFFVKLVVKRLISVIDSTLSEITSLFCKNCVFLVGDWCDVLTG